MTTVTRPGEFLENFGSDLCIGGLKLNAQVSIVGLDECLLISVGETLMFQHTVNRTKANITEFLFQAACTELLRLGYPQTKIGTVMDRVKQMMEQEEVKVCFA